jgi:lysozyme
MLLRTILCVVVGLVLLVSYSRPPGTPERTGRHVDKSKVRKFVMNRKFSENGERKLVQAEGLKLEPYKCSAGHWTIGIGHKIKKGEYFTSITEDDAYKILRQDVAPLVNFLNIHLKTIVTQNQFDALVMFLFNIGETQFLNSSVFEHLKSGKYEEATIPWSQWINVTVKEECKETGKMIKKLVPVEGLINRRAMEIQLFNA